MVTVQEYIDFHVNKIIKLILYCSDNNIKEIAYCDINSTVVDVKFPRFRKIRDELFDCPNNERGVTKTVIIEEIIRDVKNGLKIVHTDAIIERIVNNYYKDVGRGSIEVILK